MVPSSFQLYFNSTSTLFLHYFYTLIVKNYCGTSEQRAKNDGSHLCLTVGELRGETCQDLVLFPKSDDRFEVAKPYMVIKRRKGCSTAHTIEKEKTRKQINDDMNR